MPKRQRTEETEGAETRPKIIQNQIKQIESISLSMKKLIEMHDKRANILTAS